MPSIGWGRKHIQAHTVLTLLYFSAQERFISIGENNTTALENTYGREKPATLGDLHFTRIPTESSCSVHLQLYIHYLPHLQSLYTVYEFFLLLKTAPIIMMTTLPV